MLFDWVLATIKPVYGNIGAMLITTMEAFFNGYKKAFDLTIWFA